MKKALFVSALSVLATLPALAAAEMVPTVIPAAAPPAQATAITDAALRAATKLIKPSKIVLVGDSTTQVGSGWGGAFCDHHVTSFVACVNLARGGRSTFSYRAEGSWAVALGEMKTPGYGQVYVLIQFGHNDQPGKPGRSTDLVSEFPDNLRRYVEEARAAGATPILVTPLTRRAFKKGSLQDDLQPWAEAVRQVAREMQAPLLDLNADSVAAVQRMGARAAIDLSETPPPAEVLAAAEAGTTINAPKTGNGIAAALTSTEVAETPQARPTIVFDYTHLGLKGAALFSAEITQELARAVPAMRHDLIP